MHGPGAAGVGTTVLAEPCGAIEGNSESKMRAYNTGRQQSYDLVLMVIRLAVWMWGAAFITLFMCTGALAELPSLVLQRRLHAWPEAPALAGHLALDVALVVCGFMHGLRLFGRGGPGGRRNHADPWRHAWATFARVYPLYAAAAVAGYAMQRHQAYGQFQRALFAGLLQTLSLTQVWEPFPLHVAPWLLPVSLVLLAELVAASVATVVLVLERHAASSALQCSSCTAAGCSHLASRAASLRLRAAAGQALDGGEAGTRPLRAASGSTNQAALLATWVLRCATEGIPVAAQASLRALTALTASLSEAVCALLLAALAGCLCWRAANVPALVSNTVRYGPQYVDMPFYDAFFASPFARGHALLLGALGGYVAVRRGHGAGTYALTLWLLGLVAAAWVALAAYDRSGWLPTLGPVGRTRALAAYEPAFAACTSLLLAFVAGSVRAQSWAHRAVSRCGSVRGWLEFADIALPAYLLQPVVAAAWFAATTDAASTPSSRQAQVGVRPREPGVGELTWHTVVCVGMSVAGVWLGRRLGRAVVVQWFKAAVSRHVAAALITTAARIRTCCTRHVPMPHALWGMNIRVDAADPRPADAPTTGVGAPGGDDPVIEAGVGAPGGDDPVIEAVLLRYWLPATGPANHAARMSTGALPIAATTGSYDADAWLLAEYKLDFLAALGRAQAASQRRVSLSQVILGRVADLGTGSGIGDDRGTVSAGTDNATPVDALDVSQGVARATSDYGRSESASENDDYDGDDSVSDEGDGARDEAADDLAAVALLLQATTNEGSADAQPEAEAAPDADADEATAVLQTLVVERRQHGRGNATVVPLVNTEQSAADAVHRTALGLTGAEDRRARTAAGYIWYRTRRDARELPQASWLTQVRRRPTTTLAASIARVASTARAAALATVARLRRVAVRRCGPTATGQQGVTNDEDGDGDDGAPTSGAPTSGGRMRWRRGGLWAVAAGQRATAQEPPAEVAPREVALLPSGSRLPLHYMRTHGSGELFTSDDGLSSPAGLGALDAALDLALDWADVAAASDAMLLRVAQLLADVQAATATLGVVRP
jgi:hypothetical protein